MVNEKKKIHTTEMGNRPSILSSISFSRTNINALTLDTWIFPHRIAQHLYLMLSTLSFHIRKPASASTPAPRRTFLFNVEWMRLEINKIKETKMKCERLLWRINNCEFFVVDSVA